MTHRLRALLGLLVAAPLAVVLVSVGSPAPAAACGTATSTLVEDTVALGGVLRVQGTGWCHPTDGASAIAVKLDQGAVRRVTDIHVGAAGTPDPTIWAVIHPDETGSFDVEITVPDGTTATSVDADGAPLAEGGHWFNLLTGSLKPGDEPRSQRLDWVVGAYRPHGAPPPLGDDELTRDTRGGVTVTATSAGFEVRAPGVVEGDWLYADAYLDGAPLAPWGGTTWHEVGAADVLRLPQVDLPAGGLKLALQSGARDTVGELVGWVGVTVDDASPETGDTDGSAATDGKDGKDKKKSTKNQKGGTSAAGSTGASGASASGSTTSSGVGSSAAAPAASSAPAIAPTAPVAGPDALTSKNAGAVTSVLDGALLRVTLEKGEAGAWVHVWLYDALGDVALGWIQLDADGGFQVDVSTLGEGRFKLAVQDESGVLVGWTGAGVDVPAAVPLTAVEEAPRVQPVAATVATTDRTTTLLNVGLSVLGVLALAATCTAVLAGRTPRKA